MIRINLISRTRVSNARKKRPIPRILLWAVVACLFILIVGLGYRYFPVREIKDRIAELLPASDKSTSQKRVRQSDEYAPTSIKKRSGVEDVVQDVRSDADPVKDSGLLSLDYSEFSFHEKVCYEHLFTRKTLSFISRITPSQVEMERLELHDFRHVKSSGYAGRKEWVVRMFGSLKSSHFVTLSKPPHSYIRKASNAQGYAYRYRSDVQWGLDLDDESVDLSLSECIYKDNEEIVFDRFEKIARKTNLRLLVGPDLQSTTRHGSFYRNDYRFSAIGTFSDLAAFVKKVQQHQWYCAFSNLVITARGDGKVHVDANAVVTLRK